MFTFTFQCMIQQRIQMCLPYAHFSNCKTVSLGSSNYIFWFNSKTKEMILRYRPRRRKFAANESVTSANACKGASSQGQIERNSRRVLSLLYQGPYANAVVLETTCITFYFFCVLSYITEIVSNQTSLLARGKYVVLSDLSLLGFFAGGSVEASSLEL